MKNKIERLIGRSIDRLVAEKILRNHQFSPKISHTKDKSHGDFSSNIALVLAKKNGLQPLDLAKKIIRIIETMDADFIDKIEIGGGGFINFFLSAKSNIEIIHEILTAGKNFAVVPPHEKRVLLEFVSANPTGPLHVGHGRSAAYGGSIHRLLANQGFRVESEYYVNDGGRQMDILTVSVFLRYLEISGTAVDFPKNAYQGKYIFDIAQIVANKHGKKYHCLPDEIFANIDNFADDEARMDCLIENVKTLLGENYQTFFQTAKDWIIKDIQKDLSAFGVHYQNWFSERKLGAGENFEKTLRNLKTSGHTYKKDGALWLRTTKFNDEKDRVLVRKNGAPTYFALDVAYHADKFARGFDHLINIWGADHHGYVARIFAALRILGLDDSRLKILLVQFANLYRGGEKIPMSTRAGSFVRLHDLIDEVGRDAARFFYVLRKAEQHMDFDLDLARSQNNDNPVFYVQYAHARICSVLKNAREQFGILKMDENADFSLLNEPPEKALMKNLHRYPDVLRDAADGFEPHQLAYYLRGLAHDFHGYYNTCVFLVEDDNLRAARLGLIFALKHILKNALALLGVSAPESM